MSKKLILTETQYDKLAKFILETRFDKVIKNVVRIGDVIRIEFKNSTSNFKVISNDSGQIIMDNVDSGSANINYRYLITYTSLVGDELEVRRVHKTKEKDKLTNIKSWQKLDVKDIKNIEVLRNGSIIDSVDTPSNVKPSSSANGKKKETSIGDDFKDKMADTILMLLNQVKEGSGLKITLINHELINLCCVGKSKGSISFSLESNANVPDLKGWDAFGLEINGEGESGDEDLYELNKSILNTSDGGETFDLMIKGFSGEKTKDIWLRNITLMTPTSTCSNDIEPEKNKNEKSSEEEHNVKEMMDVILNDPLMKKAFYKQPTLWNLLVSALHGNNPQGSGIGPAMNIISQYGTAKHKKALGPNGSNFKVGKLAKFEVVNKEIFINPTGLPKDILKLSPNSEYDAMVNEYKLGDKHLTLSNKRLGFKIIVLKAIKDSIDTFEVSIIKIVKGKKTGEIKEYPKSAIIKFKNERGSGYSREEEKEVKNTK